jgi:hypothetical protein
MQRHNIYSASNLLTPELDSLVHFLRISLYIADLIAALHVNQFYTLIGIIAIITYIT